MTHDNTPTLDGTAEANSTVTLYDGSTSLGSALVNSSGSWSFTPSTVSDGGHSFTATATDEAGNTSAASAALAVTIDTAAPMVHPPSNISVNATSPAGAVVSYGVSVTDVGSPGLVATCTSALTAGLASGSTFPIGTTTMTCTAQDAAGNSSATGTFTIAVQSASQQVTNLETKVQNVRLDPPTRRNLVRILQNAQSAITKGDIVGACDKLTSFSSQVQAQAGKKLAQATANDLITDAQRIKQVLGCS